MINSPPHLPYWLAALHLPDVGPRKWMRWLSSFASIQQLFLASIDELHAAGISDSTIHHLKHPDWRLVDSELTWMCEEEHHILSLEDHDYPPLLKETADPPIVLFVRGDRAALKNLQIAIVGSRHATLLGQQTAEKMAYHLAESGLAITSGLALGIDGASHRGALAANGVTIGVAGTGLHHSYPKSHRSLITEIINRNGAVISEFPLNTPPKAANFPRRNRIIAGLSVGVLVVEAALKSGSLITARLSLNEGREVFAIPGSIHHPLSRGCHYLIKQGAKLVEQSEDILEELGPFIRLHLYKEEHNKKPEPELVPDLTEIEKALLTHIGYEITSIDVILSRSRLTIGEVSSILLTLELQGYIQAVTGGYIQTIAEARKCGSCLKF